MGLLGVRGCTPGAPGGIVDPFERRSQRCDLTVVVATQEESMQVVILCGGMGTRAYPFTDYLPKPMLPVDGTPILVHVMRIFAEQGHKDFLLSVGYRSEVIRDYFEGKQEWNIQIVDTGLRTDTGGRISGCRDALDETFLATYADGLCDVPLAELLSFHHSHRGLATITSVPLRSQYGTLTAEDSGRVTQFTEKPLLREHWINAGFFVFDRQVFDHWKGDNLEREVFPALAQKGLVYCHRHDGFFKSVDSYKDHQELEQMVQEGNRPWQIATSLKKT